MAYRLVFLLLFVAMAAGCPDGKRTRAGEGIRSAAAASEGGMCDEHGVLEAVCTRCRPALSAVFKAKGDWCEEHDFPASFCPVCRPELGGRPQGEVDAEEGPADGTMVRFRTKEVARLAGLRFAKAVQRETSRELPATARVVYDAARVAQINPRMPGVVREIRADVGTKVLAGTPLAIIESAGVGAEQSRLRAARTRLDVAETNYLRIAGLRDQGISSEQELLAARREREEALAEVRTALAALGMVGAAGEGSARYTLTSPIAGVVTVRNATIGRMVDGEGILFEIVDPTSMWIDLDIPEVDAPLVAAGQSVVVAFDGLPGREFAGRLSYVSPAVDPRTRTATARFPVKNPDGALRANLFGRGRIAVADPHEAVVVPREAVQRARGVHLVFVRMAEDAYEARRVTLGPGDGNLVRVVGRVQAGDDVVTQGSFLLKTETLKESIGAGCCEVD